MKRTIIAIGLAALGVASFAEEQHRNALASGQHSVVKQQVADAEEWVRSRPGYHDSGRDSTS
jgi:hypothetical protein